MWPGQIRFAISHSRIASSSVGSRDHSAHPGLLTIQTISPPLAFPIPANAVRIAPGLSPVQVRIDDPLSLRTEPNGSSEDAIVCHSGPPTQSHRWTHTSHCLHLASSSPTLWYVQRVRATTPYRTAMPIATTADTTADTVALTRPPKQSGNLAPRHP